MARIEADVLAKNGVTRPGAKPEAKADEKPEAPARKDARPKAQA